MQDLPNHQLPAERHADFVDRLRKLPDGPDRRERIIELLAKLGSTSAASVQEANHEGHDHLREDGLTETEERILYLLRISRTSAT